MSDAILMSDMASIVAADSNYRVLRRLTPRAVINEPDGSEVKIGMIIDLETTGLDPLRDEIIELAMMRFTFSPDGRIFEVGPSFTGLRQPSKPIPEEISELTGITDEMVAGHTIDPAEVAEFVEPATVIVAHHAAFDRPFAERFSTAFEKKCWACSMSELDWRREGLESSKLAWLLSQYGFFYDRHRALSDCEALLEVLTQPLPKSGMLALAALLDAARKPTFRIWAERSPFETKDTLKARGYRWNDGNDGRPKSWFIDVGPDAYDAEIEWLRGNVFKALPSDHEFRVERLTAFERFRV